MSTKHTLQLLTILLALTALLFASWPLGTSGETAGPHTTYFPLILQPSFDARFGIVLTDSGGLDHAALLNKLGVKTYYQYGWGEPAAGAERLQMVARPSISDLGLDDFIRTHPGQYWLIGNEPNVPNQDNLSPSDYAQTYRQWALRIKSIDPTARLVNGGIGNWPDNLAAITYIQSFRQEYLILYGERPPVDVWNIHAYPPFFQADTRLQSVCEPTVPKDYISSAVAYLRGAGETQPVWLTEFGVDWTIDGDPCVEAYMTDIVSWLKVMPHVDRWYWFSSNAVQYGFGGSLVGFDGQITPLGSRYRSLAGEF